MGDQEYNCELCNVPYATELELQDHKWSLMHHIKIEKVKKGAPHSCDLCMTSCSNIIEYGKHLNEDRHKLALSRRQKDGIDEPLDSFANIPDTTADMDSKPEVDHHPEMGHRPQRFNKRVDKHSRSFSQPELHTQDNSMYHSQGNWSGQPQQGPRNPQNYTHGQWPTWNDLIPGFSQSLGSVNDPYMSRRDPRSNHYGEEMGQYFRNDFGHLNWNNDSFYNPKPQQEFMNRHANRGRKGSLDSSFRKPEKNYKKIKNKQQKQNRGRSWDRGRDYDSNRYFPHCDQLHHDMNEGIREFNDTHFQRPDSRAGIQERGRGILRGSRGRRSPYDQSRSDMYSPESNSSTDSGGLKRRLEEEPFPTTGKSRRGNESNRIPPDGHHKPSLLDSFSNQRPRSRSHDRLLDRGPVSMETDQLSCSTGGPSVRKVTWSDQQLVVSSTTETQRDINKPARTRSLERLNESRKVKPDSSSERKKFGNKKDKRKSDNKRNFSPEGDGGRRQYKNSVKEKTSTDSVLERAEKLCKKLRNEREKAKQQRSLSEKQKKMSKTEEINYQIEELSRKNRENIKGHLETVENTLLSKSVSSDITISSNMSAPHEQLLNKAETMPVKHTAGVTKDLTNKDNSACAKSDISERIAKTKADIDAIRAKIENSVQSETGTSTQKEVTRQTDRVDTAPTKSGRTPTPSDLLSPGMTYSPSSSAQKPDHNALLKMVKSPRSTKERLWLAEMLRTHAKSQTKLSLPRFNLKFSDICTGSERPNDLTDFDISNLAPSVQLEIADIIEADTKPDIIELQKLLDNASAENAELDSNILSELGIMQTPSKEDYRPRSVSPMRAGSPIVTGSSRYVDNRPSLSIEDLSTAEDLPTNTLMQSKGKPVGMPAPQPDKESTNTRFSEFVPHSDNKNRERNYSLPLTALPKASEYEVTGIKIKEEKIDDGYEMASAVSMPPPNTHLYPGQYESLSRDSQSPAPQTRVLSPVRKSIHTQNLYSGGSDVPERDVYRHRSKSPETDGRSALEKVTAILDGAPTVDKVLSGQKTSTSATEAASKGGQDKDTGFDSSQNSQTSSVLDQVYNISLQEENVRHEINTMDLKIKQLQRLIDEASDHLNRFSVQRKELVDQEDKFRSSRMKLLQESRSQQGSSSSQAEGGPLLGNLTDAQLQNLNNPVFIKFLMSQRQSDLSSMGGFSNVETGSQSEQEPSTQRRASITSNSDPQPQQYQQANKVASGNSQRFGDGQLFSQSIDALSGSTETLSSSHSKSKISRDSGMPVPGTSLSVVNPERSNPAQAKDSAASSNSISLLNTPLEKVGFITLDALLKGDSDIGKLLHKSLESFNKGNNPGEEASLQKQESNESRSASLPGAGVKGWDRERRDSTLSIGSDDILMSGSDAEKRSGKVSMKYMGTLPDGVSYNTLAKQMSGGSGNKTVMFTVLNSPEAMSQLKRASDGEVSPQVFPQAKPEVRANTDSFDTRSDLTESTNTITADINDNDTHSVKSNYSLGEQIKRMCEGQNPDSNTSMQIFTPRSEESSGEKTLEDEASKQNSNPKTSQTGTPVRDCYIKLDKLDPKDYTNLLLKSKPELQRSPYQDAGSPVRKRLKSKKERDQMSRRKQKESFILNSDTNSEADMEAGSLSSSRSRNQSRASVSKSEDDLVQSGSEEAKTPRLSEKTDVKKSLLDEVQLETETPSDSCEDKSQKLDGTSYSVDERLRLAPDRLATFRANIKTKLGTERTVPSIEYKGPSLSVAAIQQFQDDLYVCYNGSEVRRFNIKTGEILKELDCSPYLVNTLHVTSVEERQDILYTGGACKKLMLFEPKKFNLIGTFDYSARIACLHENWDRLFIGLSDGCISVRSLKTDKEVNSFSCTSSTVSCLASTSAGMTKMLCLGTADKIIYVADAITGLLITMLEGHTLPPLCIQVFGETVLSGAADQTLLVHNVSTGDLIKTVKSTKPITSLWTDDAYIYLSCCDNLVRCYDSNFKLEKVCYGAGKGIVTSGLVYAGMLVTGSREGLVEAVPVSLLNGSWECKFGVCSLEFTCYDHLKFHVLSDHNSSRASQCTHRDCQYSFPNPESKQEHVLSHLR